jgi:hypothetical protein
MLVLLPIGPELDLAVTPYLCRCQAARSLHAPFFNTYVIKGEKKTWGGTHEKLDAQGLSGIHGGGSGGKILGGGAGGHSTDAATPDGAGCYQD